MCMFFKKITQLHGIVQFLWMFECFILKFFFSKRCFTDVLRIAEEPGVIAEPRDAIIEINIQMQLLMKSKLKII